MEFPDSVSSIVEGIQAIADVERVYGDPIEREDRTIVPVARVAYGVGGGFGHGPNVDTDERDEATPVSGGSGGGGGGVVAKPLGALEITDQDTRFVGITDRSRLVGVFAIGVIVGWLLRRVSE